MPLLETVSLSNLPENANHGEVFTRRWVVELILDLCGYTSDRDLGSMVLIEPACGGGAFLTVAVTRLSESLRARDLDLRNATGAIRAWDLKDSNVDNSRRAVEATLVDLGWSSESSAFVAAEWVRQGDFLLTDHDFGSADFVVGNPPYVRLEEMAEDWARAYRVACPTMSGRADLYIGFFEMGLRLLRSGGVLGFICADRWMRNQYGKGLRKFIVDSYSVDATIVMHDVDCFDDEVSAYPAITVVSARPQGSSVIASTTSDFGDKQATQLARWALGKGNTSRDTKTFSSGRLPGWFTDADQWPWGTPAQLALLEDLNARFQPLEHSAPGTKIGIGVATGNDDVFIVPSADVEPDRLLPLVMRGDLASGRTSWGGFSLVNPWLPDGSLVDLDHYPRLSGYLEVHREALQRRHTAKRGDWYRTIDKVNHSLIDRPKLLFPDMKMQIDPVLEPGGLYPHHNLYFVISDGWDLEVLGGLLLSKVAEFFVDRYTVKMRGGTLRFQAQYLRKIRVPFPEQLTPSTSEALREAFRKRDSGLATETALAVYGIDGL